MINAFLKIKSLLNSSTKMSKENLIKISKSKKKNEDSEKEFKSYISCPGCGRVPFLRLKSIVPLEVRIKCHFCETQFIRTLPEIEAQTEKEPDQEAKPLGYCYWHRDKVNEYYCTKYKSDFCCICKETGINKNCKNYLILADLPPKSAFDSKIQEAKDFFESSTNSLKKLCLSRAKTEEEVQKIEMIFEKNYLVNMEILRYVELIDKSFSENEYEAVINLQDNTEFSLKEISENQSNEEILEQIGNYFLLDVDPEECDYPVARFRADFVKSENFHQSQVASLCLLKDGRLASGSYKMMIIINLDADIPDLTFEAHTSWVYHLLLLKNDNLVSCSKDLSIKFWEIDNLSYKCISVLKGHNHRVTKIISVSDNYIASCSKDKTIKIWEVKISFEVSKTLRGHKGFIESIVKLRNSDVIVSGSSSIIGDSSIRFWLLNSSFCEGVINDVECYSKNNLIEVRDGLVLSGGEYKIYFIDAIGKKLIKTVDYLNTIYSMIQVDEENILAGDRWGRLLSFNINDDSLILVNSVHNSTVNDIIWLSNNEKRLITCSGDQTIKVWDFLRT